MGNFKQIKIAVLLIVVLLAVSGCNSKANSMEDIKERGKLIVGTSADFPPYEFYEDGEYTGFDMELIKEIAKRMDLEVEIQDMSFDTLIATLKQGKVDVLLASMSASPERREQADFSEIYYKSLHGFVTKEGSDVHFNNAEDLKNYKVGIQTGTAHEKWVVDNLVNKDLMPEENLLRYEKAEVGMLDVANGSIDVYVVDLPVAKANVAKNKKLKIAYEYDINPVHGGIRIAVKKGQNELLNELDKYILELQEEGFIEELEEKWLSGEIE